MALLDRFKKTITGKADKKENTEKNKKGKKVEKIKQGTKKANTRIQAKFHSVIQAPRITEKTTMLSNNDNILVFKTSLKANKKEIGKICERNYNVPVVSVNIINQPSKKRRRGQKIGKKSGYKKAIVKFKKKIEL